MIIDFNRLSIKEAKEYSVLWDTVKKEFPEFNDDQIAIIISISVGHCPVCRQDNSDCQCWNDI